MPLVPTHLSPLPVQAVQPADPVRGQPKLRRLAEQQRLELSVQHADRGGREAVRVGLVPDQLLDPRVHHVCGQASTPGGRAGGERGAGVQGALAGLSGFSGFRVQAFRVFGVQGPGLQGFPGWVQFNFLDTQPDFNWDFNMCVIFDISVIFDVCAGLRAGPHTRWAGRRGARGAGSGDLSLAFRVQGPGSRVRFIFNSMQVRDTSAIFQHAYSSPISRCLDNSMVTHSHNLFFIRGPRTAKNNKGK